MTTRNWYCPHPPVAGDCCWVTCRPNSCSKLAVYAWEREAFYGPPNRTTRVYMDPKMIVDRNPLPPPEDDSSLTIGTYRSDPIEDFEP